MATHSSILAWEIPSHGVGGRGLARTTTKASLGSLGSQAAPSLTPWPILGSFCQREVTILTYMWTQAQEGSESSQFR